MQENRRIQGHLFGAFSVLVWGTTFVSTRLSGTAHRGQGPHAPAETVA